MNNNWEVKLKGEASYLKELATVFCTPDIFISNHDEGFFLKSIKFNQFKDKRELYEFSLEMIDFINTSSKISCNRHIPLEPDGFWLVGIDGAKKLDFFAIGDVTLSLQQCVYGNSVPPREWYDLWYSNENIKYVFRLFNSTSLLDWFSLFMIYETIRDDPQQNDGGKSKIESWINVEKNKAFFDTANWYRHSNHGKSKGKPNLRPKSEISLSDGNNLIRDLINRWLDWKLNS